jgi:hypothetical protein
MRRASTSNLAPGGAAARLLSFLALAALLIGCQIQLVPQHDPAIVTGLTAANEKTLQLFAALSRPGARTPYPEREATYDELIGSFDALRVQAAARPVPESRIAGLLVSRSAADLKPEDIERLQNPTPDILQTIIDTLARMREVDSEGRLSAGMLPGFKNSYELSIDQTLTFEKALEQ